jgi:hypothetical protein
VNGPQEQTSLQQTLETYAKQTSVLKSEADEARGYIDALAIAVGKKNFTLRNWFIIAWISNEVPKSQNYC